MNWQDFLLDRECDPAELRMALKQAFRVPSAKVAVVDSIEDTPNGMAVVAERSAVKGDFRCLLSVYVLETMGPVDPTEIVGRLCVSLGTRALLPDDSEDPYAMLLVDQFSNVRPVSLDVRCLDELNEYRLAGND